MDKVSGVLHQSFQGGKGLELKPNEWGPWVGWSGGIKAMINGFWALRQTPFAHSQNMFLVIKINNNKHREKSYTT